MDQLQLVIVQAFRVGADSVAGSIVMTADCGHVASLSPSGQHRAATKRVLTICTACAAEKNLLDRYPAAAPQETWNELAEHLGTTPAAVRALFPGITDLPEGL